MEQKTWEIQSESLENIHILNYFILVLNYLGQFKLSKLVQIVKDMRSRQKPELAWHNYMDKFIGRLRWTTEYMKTKPRQRREHAWVLAWLNAYVNGNGLKLCQRRSHIHVDQETVVEAKPCIYIKLSHNRSETQYVYITLKP